jgi:integrase
MHATIDLKTVRLAWDKKTNDWKRSSTGDIEFVYVERPSGRLRYKTTRLAGEPDAQAFVRALKADLGDHQAAQTIEPTFREVAEIYQRDKRLSPSFKYVISVPIAKFGDRRLSSISAPEILAYKAERRQTVGDGRIRNEIGYIKTIRQWAVDHDFIAADKKLSKIERPQEEEQPERIALTADESNALWDVVTAYKHGNARRVERLSRAARWGAIAIDTGARKMAICTLRWSTQIDFANDLIHFDKCDEKIPKNKKRGKSPMSPRLKALLLRAYAERTSDTVLDSKSDIEGMWASARGTEFAHVNPHLLRHSFITNMILNGTDVYIVAKIVGDNPLTIIKRYEHILPESVRDKIRWSASQQAIKPLLELAAA